MRLRGIEFGACWDAAGLRGWHGEGYRFHRLPFINRWYDFTGSTPVAKTSTLPRQLGNLPLLGKEHDYAPQELFPRCVWWSWRHAIVLNAVDLSGPGAGKLFSHTLLRSHRYTPFMISWASQAITPKERLREFRTFVRLLGTQLLCTPTLRKQLGLQINVSCANARVDRLSRKEIATLLDVASELCIPLVVKIDVFMPLPDVARISENAACDALCASNAIRFGTHTDMVDWDQIFPHGSPLARRNPAFGNGALSGEPLRKLVCVWLGAIRRGGIDIPVNAGGGITHPDHVKELVYAGLRRGRDSIFVGYSAAILRPWNIRAIIECANRQLTGLVHD